jgi:glycosyltransferase involved in cell wall biosynthesis
MRVLRIYHGGRDHAHRGRDRALAALGVDLTLVVPRDWPDDAAEQRVSEKSLRIVELPVRRAGDVNRHRYAGELAEVVESTQPDLLDVHEEPVSVAARQWLRAAPATLPIVMYTAQNIDKRYPPPFAEYERRALRRAAALYPCSRQAASVARGKGFAGHIDVLPLGYDDAVFHPGEQSLNTDEIVLLFAGRLVREKGIDDALRVLARVHATRPARLVVSGAGRAEADARELAASLGVGDRVEWRRWQSEHELARAYRDVHVLLVPSRATHTWTEQFGRVIVEAQASGAVVAGYATGAIPEVAADAGVLAAAGNVAALGNAVVQLISNTSEYDQRRETGRLLATGRTWGAVAARQADLYRAVHAGNVATTELARSPSRRRLNARIEFGPTAVTSAGRRPFAAPFLRYGGIGPSVLAAVIDAAAALRSRLTR